MIVSAVKTLTLEEFLKLPETKPASEYIDSEIIQKPMPQGKHSIIQAEFVTTVNAVVKPQKIACAFPELRCTFSGRSIVPDVSIFAWERIPMDENGDVANVFTSAPDWAIEILSPEQSQTKVVKKILHCLKNGTSMVWLVDPDDRSVIAYPPGKQPELFDEEQQQLPVPSLVSGYQLTVGQLFGWLKL